MQQSLYRRSGRFSGALTAPKSEAPRDRCPVRIGPGLRQRSWPVLAPPVEAALGRPIGDVFGKVDPEPLASATVAQVHAAWLLVAVDTGALMTPGVRWYAVLGATMLLPGLPLALRCLAPVFRSRQPRSRRGATGGQ